MKTNIATTNFAPAERVSIEVVQRQATTIAQMPITSRVLNSVLNYVFILNPQRQIVFATRNWEDLLPGRKTAELLGLRPGEALDCIHARDHEGGCGTSVFCQECGAVKAILAGLAGRHAIEECHLTRLVNCREEAMDLLVYGSPLLVDGETYLLLAVMDISHENRRRALERIFFHDVINSAGGLESLAELMRESAPNALREDLQVLAYGLRDLHQQVQTQKDLAAAEKDELTVTLSSVSPGALLEEVVLLYQKSPAAEDRVLCCSPDLAITELVTDPMLLRRVLGNLIKNALEATAAGQRVVAGCVEEDCGVRFWVHNPGFMPKEVRLQVFSRSFTTKGLGRGLGTYSAKLLTERYLKGRIGFTTDSAKGTIFFVTLPWQQPAPAQSPVGGTDPSDSGRV